VEGCARPRHPASDTAAELRRAAAEAAQIDKDLAKLGVKEPEAQAQPRRRRTAEKTAATEKKDGEKKPRLKRRTARRRRRRRRRTARRRRRREEGRAKDGRAEKKDADKPLTAREEGPGRERDLRLAAVREHLENRAFTDKKDVEALKKKPGPRHARPHAGDGDPRAAGAGDAGAPRA